MIKAVAVCAGFLEITSLPLGLSIQYTGEDFDFAEVVDSAALEGEKNGGFRFRSPSPPLAGGSRESSATAAALESAKAGLSTSKIFESCVLLQSHNSTIQT